VPATEETKALAPSNEPEANDFLDFDDDGKTTDAPTELGGAETNPTDTPNQRPPEDSGLSQYEKELSDAFDIEDPGQVQPAKKDKTKEEPKGEGEDADGDYKEQIINMAVSAGITEEAARKWPGGPEGLAHALQYGQYLVGQNRGGSARTEPAPKQEPVEEKSEPIEEFTFEIDSDKFEPELVEVVQNVVKAANSHFAKQGERIVRLEGQLNSLVNGVRSQSASQALQQFDRTIADLGDDYVPLLGKGSTMSLGERTKAYQNRQKVAQALIKLGDLFDSEGLSDTERFKRAVDAALGNQSTKASTRKLTTQLRSQSGKFISPASQRGRQTVGKNGSFNPDQEAKEYVRDFMREAGMSDDDAYL